MTRTQAQPSGRQDHRRADRLHHSPRIQLSLLRPNSESMEPEDITLVLGCPFCGRPVPYPGPAAAGSEPMAECERCDVEFGFLPQEVRDIPVERPRRPNETLRSLRQFKLTEGVE